VHHSRDRVQKRRLRLTIALAIALATPAASLAASSERAEAAGPPPPLQLLCGVAWPIDQLLACVPPSSPVDGSTPEQPRGGTSTTAAHSFEDRVPATISATPRYVDDLLLVKFRASASAREQENALRDAGVTVTRRIEQLRVAVVQMPPDRRDEALSTLRRSDAVADAERDAVVEGLTTTPNDTDWSSQWGLKRVGYPAAWDRTRGLASVVVAVLDTGVAGAVPDLQHSVTGGYNVLAPQTDAADDNGHGTSVAGIIAARTNNLEGIAGICWTCSVLPIKVLAANGTGDTALLSEGIVHAVDAGARVITMSLGGPVDAQTLDDAVAYALARNTILIAAAGNNGASAPFYPAAIPGVIGVAATDQADHLYSWSNFGSWVDVAAPGCNPAPTSTGGYSQFCGTSSAAPVVAGLIALELSLRPTATRDAVVDAIMSTTVRIGDVVAFGRIDASSALAALAGPPDAASADAAAGGAASLIAILRGRLSSSAGSRSYRRSIDHSALAAVLRFTGQKTLTLSIRTESGAFVTRATGRSPLRLAREFPRGTYLFTIKGRKQKASFSLALSGIPRSSG